MIERAPLEPRDTRAMRLVREAPPPTPACFDSRADWQDWLLQSIASGEAITRISDTGAYAGRRVVRLVFVSQIDHCADCTAEHRARMERTARCSPTPAQRLRDELAHDPQQPLACPGLPMAISAAP